MHQIKKKKKKKRKRKKKKDIFSPSSAPDVFSPHEKRKNRRDESFCFFRFSPLADDAQTVVQLPINGATNYPYSLGPSPFPASDPHLIRLCPLPFPPRTRGRGQRPSLSIAPQGILILTRSQGILMDSFVNRGHQSGSFLTRTASTARALTSYSQFCKRRGGEGAHGRCHSPQQRERGIAAHFAVKVAEELQVEAVFFDGGSRAPSDAAKMDLIREDIEGCVLHKRMEEGVRSTFA